MTAPSDASAGAKSRPGETARLPAWAWWAITLAIIAVRAGFTTGRGLSDYLGDMDDAARLLQVKEFIAGSAWFDTTTMKMGGNAGMLSHWSRLIDLPIAALIVVLNTVMPVTTAELAARAIWPLLVLAPLLWCLFRTVAVTAGEQAGRIALILAMLCPLGLYQFDVGRIDHHNVMIATTVSAALLMWAHPSRLSAWRTAGALCGLALTIGFEALAPVAALAVAAAVWGLLDRGQAPAVRQFTLALMLAIAAGFLVGIPPSRWLDVRCDAISLNLVALSSIAGLGLVFALTSKANWSLTTRLLLAASIAVFGLIVYAWLEPKCLAGPMGQLPAEIKSVWLDYVAETRSILADLLHGKIEQSLGLIAFFAAAIAMQGHRLASSRSARDVFLLALVSAFAAFACWQYKYIAYASFLSLAPVACWISSLRGTNEIRPASAQLIAAILFSQASLIGLSGYLQKVFSAPLVLSERIRNSAEACASNTAVSDLAHLPPGLIAARIDLGAYVAALTPHRVLSAPYHRISSAIITNHKIFAARSAGEAAALIAREGIDYVVTCKGLDDPFVAEPEWQGTLRADLVSGSPPAFLIPVALANPQTLFNVWRVDKARLNPQL